MQPSAHEIIQGVFLLYFQILVPRESRPTPMVKLQNLRVMLHEIFPNIPRNLTPFRGIQRTRRRRGMGVARVRAPCCIPCTRRRISKGAKGVDSVCGGAFNLIATPRPCEIPAGGARSEIIRAIHPQFPSSSCTSDAIPPKFKGGCSLRLIFEGKLSSRCVNVSFV